MTQPSARPPFHRTLAILLVWFGAVALALFSLFSISRGAAWGLVVEPRDTSSGARIARVLPVGAGRVSALRPGEVVLAVDGQPFVVTERQPLPPAHSITVAPEGASPRLVLGPTPSLGFVLLAFGAAFTFLLLGSTVYRWSAHGGAGLCFFLLNAAFGSALLAAPASTAIYNWAISLAAVCAIAATASLAAFFLWFPSPLRAASTFSWVLGGITLVLSVAYLTANAVADETPAALSVVLWGWLGCSSLAAIGLVVTRALRSSSRSLLAPILGGVLVGVAPVLILVGLPRVIGLGEFVPVELALVALGAIPFGFAYAILRHKVFALDAVLRRVLIRAGAAGVTLVLFTLVWTLALALGATPTLAAGTAALVAAFVAPPLWLRAPGVLDALIFPALSRAAALTGLPPTGDSPASVAHQTALGIRHAVPTRWVYMYVPDDGPEAAGADDRWLPIGGDGEPPLGRDPAALTARDAAAHQPFVFVVPVRGSKGPVATLVAGPRLDGSPLSGIDREVVSRLALWSADALEAALLRQGMEVESNFRSGLSALAGQLAAAAHPREIVRLTGMQAARLLGATHLNIWRVMPDGTLRPLVRAEALDRDAPRAEPGAPVEALDTLAAEYVERVRGGQVVRFANADLSSGLALALGQMDESDIIVVVTRTPGQAPFNVAEERRAREIVEHAGGALRRARVAAQAAEAETLREMDRVKSEFMDMVAHDLRGPLSVIWGFLELLEVRSRDMTPDAVVETVRDMRQSTRTMLQMIEDLMTASRLARGNLALKRQAISVRPFLETLAHGYRTLPNGERLRVDVPADLYVHADETRLAQMVGNIVLNAFRYAPGGDIVVRAYRHPTVARSITVEVEDHGPGISPEEQPKVWEKFYRGRQGPSAPQGTGLGLSLVRTLADLHGGRAELTSEVGRGSTFRLILPEWREPSTPEGAGPHGHDDSASDGRPGTRLVEPTGSPASSRREPRSSLLMRLRGAHG